MQAAGNHQHQEDEALQAPPGLVSALKELPQEPSFIPATLDEAVLRAAQQQLSRPEGRRVKWIGWMPWLAATGAVILLLAVIPSFSKKPASVAVYRTSIAREDLNHDGRVDILDAFALARQLRSGTRPDPQLDLNGDGVVDERDVATLAAQAVKLEKGGHS